MAPELANVLETAFTLVVTVLAWVVIGGGIFKCITSITPKKLKVFYVTYYYITETNNKKHMLTVIAKSKQDIPEALKEQYYGSYTRMVITDVTEEPLFNN